MPIRINLLAEAKIAEEMRRHDPVKRVLFVGALAVAVTLVWSSSLQLKTILAKNEVSNRQMDIAARTNEYQRVQLDQKKITAAKSKLDALKKMTNSRFLQGNLLNALQQVNVDGVRLMRLKVDQEYIPTAGTASQTTKNGGVITGRPATITEKVVVSLDALDSSANPGDQVNKFKEAVANQSYFKASLSKTNGVQLISLSAPQVIEGKPSVLFTLKCNYPDCTR